MIKNNFPEVVYIRTEKNIGAGGRNLGMLSAKGDIIITLDDDVVGLRDHDIEFLSEKFTLDPILSAINFQVVNKDGETCNWVHHCKMEEYFEQEFQTYEITEGAVAFRKKALEKSGYYPESFFLSHEGPDLAFRLLKNGYKVIYSGNVRVKHLFSEEGRESWRNYYYDTRNQIWLAAKHFPLNYAIVYLGRGLISMLIYSIRDGYFRYWAKALKDGFGGLREALKGRQVLGRRSMSIIKSIDSKRPHIIYLVKKRLLKKGDLLFK